VRERVARTDDIEVISDVDRKAYRRQLHRWLGVCGHLSGSVK